MARQPLACPGARRPRRRGTGALPLRCEIITCHQLTPELAEPLSQSRRAVFIDADAQGKPGDIRRRTVRPQVPASSAFTHSCTPSGLLASAEALYGHRPQAVVITVSAQSFAFGDTLSPAVSAAFPEVVDQVGREVRNPRPKRLMKNIVAPTFRACPEPLRRVGTG